MPENTSSARLYRDARLSLAKRMPPKTIQLIQWLAAEQARHERRELWRRLYNQRKPELHYESIAFH